VQEGRPSRTAEYMALFRALEGVRPPASRLFVDPLARAFLSPPLRLVADLSRLPGVARLVCRIIDRRYPGSRTSAVARTRFIDDRVRAAIAAGAEQLVLLGAGFDARPYRLPECGRIAVFEVDHPATLAKKRALVEASVGARAAHVRFVPTDFERDDVRAGLAAAGYDESRRTVFVWEGVTNYLTKDAVDGTLRGCARAAPGSRIVFTYVHRAVLDDPASFPGTGRLFAFLGAAGERWTFGLDPSRTADYLAERGLSLDEDVGAAEYRARCFGRSAAGMRGYEFYRIACARVPEPGAARSALPRGFGSV
jgi:methyltransferase (TIGR00027 family)